MGEPSPKVAADKQHQERQCEIVHGFNGEIDHVDKVSANGQFDIRQPATFSFVSRFRAFSFAIAIFGGTGEARLDTQDCFNDALRVADCEGHARSHQHRQESDHLPPLLGIEHLRAYM